MRGARQQVLTQGWLGAVQRQRQRGLDAALRQHRKGPLIAHGGEHQVLVADAACGAQQLDRFHHRLQVVRGLAHAHEHHLGDSAQRARQRHLRHDLGAAHLP
jgi:hypothetical protein